MSGVCSYRRFVGLVIIILAVVFMAKVLMPEESSLKRLVVDGLPKAINLTDSEQMKLEEFKGRMRAKIVKEEALQFDVFLIKWLQIADFDVEEAEKLLTEVIWKKHQILNDPHHFCRIYEIKFQHSAVSKNLKWRSDENIDKIHDEDWSDLKSDFEYNTNEVDYIGRPVLFMNLGAWDIKQAVKSGKKERLERFITKMMDEAVQLVLQKYKAEQQVTQYWMLIQLDDFGYFRGACVQCISVYLELAKTFEHKYPKLGYQIITVNTPGVFSIVFNLIKPVLSEETQENCHLLGDREEWEPIVSKLGVRQLEMESGE